MFKFGDLGSYIRDFTVVWIGSGCGLALNKWEATTSTGNDQVCQGIMGEPGLNELRLKH